MYPPFMVSKFYYIFVSAAFAAAKTIRSAYMTVYDVFKHCDDFVYRMILELDSGGFKVTAAFLIAELSEILKDDLYVYFAGRTGGNVYGVAD